MESAFSPVAALSAPAFSIAEVAMLFVPTTVRMRNTGPGMTTSHSRVLEKQAKLLKRSDLIRWSKILATSRTMRIVPAGVDSGVDAAADI